MLSVDVIPSTRKSLTVVPGTKRPAVGTYTRDNSASFTVADEGFNHQLTYFRANGYEWQFAPGNFFELVTFDSTIPGITAAIPAEDFTSSVVSNLTATTFRITYGIPPTANQVIIDGTVNTTLGALLLTWSYNIDGVFFPTVGCWGMRIKLPVVPYEGAVTKDEMVAMMPAYGGITYRNATAVLPANANADYPGFHNSGVGVYPEASSGATSGHQLCACWHIGKKACLSLRSKNTDGRGSRITYNGDGDNSVFTFTEFPTNQLLSQSASSAFAVEIRPMRGDWYDASTYYRERVEAESAPFVARGKFVNQGSGTTNLSTTRRQSDAMFIFAPTADTTVGWARPAEEIRRLREFLGTDLKYIAQWYGWSANGSTNWPDIYPANSHFLTTYQTVQDAGGVYQTVYVYPTVWGIHSQFFADHSLSSLVVLGPDQNPKQIGSGDTSQLGEFGNATAQTLIFDTWKTLTTQISTSLAGEYIDTISGNGVGGDYRLALANGNRGVGSPYYNAGKKTVTGLWRTEYRVTQNHPTWMILGEWADEHMLPLFDSQGGGFDLYPLSLDIFMPSYRTVYSQYVGLYNYETGFLSFSTSDIQDWDIAAWRLERQFHAGGILGFASFGFNTGYVISQSGDGTPAAYSSVYSAYQLPFLGFMKNCIRSRSDLKTRDYFEGRRLRPLPDSPEDRLVRYGYEIINAEVIPGGVEGPVLDNADVGSSVWLSTATGRGVGIILSNHHLDSRTFRVLMTPEDYPEVVGKEYLYRRNADGTRTFLAHAAFPLDVEVTVLAKEVQVYELISTPDS